MDNDEMSMFNLFGNLNGYSADEGEEECFDFWNYAMNVLDRIEARKKLSLYVGVDGDGSFQMKVFPVELDDDSNEDS